MYLMAQHPQHPPCQRPPALPPPSLPPPPPQSLPVTCLPRRPAVILVQKDCGDCTARRDAGHIQEEAGGGRPQRTGQGGVAAPWVVGRGAGHIWFMYGAAGGGAAPWQPVSHQQRPWRRWAARQHCMHCRSHTLPDPWPARLWCHVLFSGGGVTAGQSIPASLISLGLAPCQGGGCNSAPPAREGAATAHQLSPPACGG
jgi:hypothetical protein